MRLGCILNKKGDTAHLPYRFVFENMTLEQVQKATGLAEGFSDEKSSRNASIGLMMKGGALRLCGFESKNGIIDRLTNENVADAAADMLSNNK